ncbi:MAG: hypothetical protein ABIO46_06685 [Chitinophagales bacterium]
MKEQDLENSFEKQLRQKSADFRLKPSDDVWANVKISLQRNNRKRRFLWLWAAAVGLLLGTGTTAWYFMNSSVSTSNSITPVIISDAPVEKEQPVIKDLATAKEKTTSAKIADENKPGTNAQEAIAEENNSPFVKSAIPLNKSIGNDTANKISLANRPSNSTSENSKSTITSEMADTNFPAVENRNSEQEMTTLNNDVIPLIPFSDTPQNIAFTSVHHPSLIPQEGSPATSRFSIRAEVIPLISYIKYGTQNLALASTAADVAFADSVSKLSRASGKPLIGFSTGIIGQFDISKRFSVNAGIHFTQTGERNSFLQAGTFEMFSDTATWLGTGGVTSNAGNYQFSTGNIETTTRYNWLDGSVNGEWHFYNDRKNSISVFAGMGVSHFISYTLSAEGYDKSALHNNSLLGNQQNPPVFHAYQLTTATGINYHRLISDRVSLVAGFQFHYYLSSITLKDIPVEMHPYWFGINTGITYHF